MYQSKWCALLYKLFWVRENGWEVLRKKQSLFAKYESRCARTQSIEVTTFDLKSKHNGYIFFFSRLELFSSLVSDWFWYLMRIFLCPMFPYGNQFYKFLSIERQTQKLNGTKCVECFIVVLPILYCSKQKIVFFTFVVDVFAFILRINVITVYCE